MDQEAAKAKRTRSDYVEQHFEEILSKPNQILKVAAK